MQYATKERTTAGVLLAAASVFVWGITFVNTKYLLRSFSALEILIIRFLAAYLGLWILSPHRLHLPRKRDELLFVFAGLTGVAVYQFLENIAISYTTASNVSIIVSICPIFTAITAQMFLKEKHITAFFLLGFVLAIFGVALVSFNGSLVLHIAPKGDILALIAAVSWGFYSLFVSKINALSLHPIQVTRRIFFWALVFMLPLAVFGVLNPEGVSSVTFDAGVNAERFSNPLNWVNLLFLGWGASAFCFVAWNGACKMLGTVRATVGIYLIPVVTIIFAFFALGEKISVMGAVGAVLTIAGLVLSTHSNRK